MKCSHLSPALLLWSGGWLKEEGVQETSTPKIFLRRWLFLHGLTLPSTNLLMKTRTVILMQEIGLSKLMSPGRSTKSLFYCLSWNCWESRSLTSFVKLYWPANSVMILVKHFSEDEGRILRCWFPMIPGLQQIVIYHSLRERQCAWFTTTCW